jgi:hypothetical protein
VSSFLTVESGGYLQIEYCWFKTDVFPFIDVKDGNLLIKSCKIIKGSPELKDSFISQSKGYTTIRGGLDIFINDIGSCSKTLVDVTGGEFQMYGNSLSVPLSIKFLKGKSSPLFLNYHSSDDEIGFAGVFLKYVKFSYCTSTVESPSTGTGGLISVRGKTEGPIVILEGVEFLTISLNTGNGGAFYGEFLKQFWLKDSIFSECTAPSGSGGAIYVKDVTTYLTDPNGVYYLYF